ncbi:helix-turn-helix domain-containing protein [Beggiatoa leptomitoformis]|uniref:Helix-turn-helix domain-containing protein n=1 Tax=Beggiatoa leptomitoformis TaxID=288004 RepID=A0A2N9YG34_9GAMM|nr:helix-turn-helix transcriptional regulator [Beggiatoa leptomitoformis]ALG68237.1 helix-turn-helix domain-containing protein [Beggiatoa leptomitoformis]AUI69457.1 helix-turn-helix domain-containing protein [Beggiatoa leptomitoformis]
MGDDVNFKEIILEIQQQKKLSYEKIGRLVGMSRAGINRICNDGTMPRWDVGQKLISLMNQ